MAKTNVAEKREKVRTHEGAPAFQHMNQTQELRRSVLSCLLWEDEFYESGQSIADRIVELAMKTPHGELAELAVEARSKFNLRHVPLLLLAILADQHRGDDLVPETIYKVIQRADELGEFLAIFAKMKKVEPSQLKKVLTHGIRRGLAKAVGKFSAYSLAKYDRDAAVKLRDVAFLVHPRAWNDEQGKVLAKLVNKTFFPEKTKGAGFPVKETYKLDGEPGLESPDTWEVALSAGADKKETFERLLREEKLGYFALIRNLRNMTAAGVGEALAREAILARKGGAERLFPFRYIAASRAAPQYEPYLDQALQAAILDLPVLKGKTIVLIDVSGSMKDKLSGKSDMTRMDAAAALGSIVNGDVRMFTFSYQLVEVPPRRGMAGVEAVINSQSHGGTALGSALLQLQTVLGTARNRLIVVTDEQSSDRVKATGWARKYLINVASYRNGVGYNDGWVHIDGFSENVLRYIYELEASKASGEINSQDDA